MDKLIHKLKFQVSDVEFNINWMNKTNFEKGSELYSKEELQYSLGVKAGLLKAIAVIEQEIKDREQADKIGESMDNMLRLLGEMNEIIDRNEKQPKSDTSAVEV